MTHGHPCCWDDDASQLVNPNLCGVTHIYLYRRLRKLASPGLIQIKVWVLSAQESSLTVAGW
jgi:hypothetical protein